MLLFIYLYIIYVYYDLYIMIFIYYVHIYKKDVLHCLPVHVFTASQVTGILHGRGLLALASVGRCCEAVFQRKDGEGRAVVMILLARIEI